MTTTATVHNGPDSPASPVVAGPVRRDFRIYLTGHVSTTFGTTFTALAVAVVAVQWFQATPLQIGLLSAAATIPSLLLGPAVGVLADRVRRPRRLLVITDLACAALLTALAAGLAGGLRGIHWLVAFAVLLGAGSLVTRSLFFTHINSLGLPELAPARATLQAGTYVSGAAGQATVGPAIAMFGPVIAFAVDAACYLLSAVCLRSLRASDRNPAVDRRGSAAEKPDLMLGMRTVFRGRLGLLVAFAVISQLGFVGCLALRPLFLLETLGLPVNLVAAPSFCAAVLGVVGSLAAGAALRRGRRAETMLALCWAGGAVSALLLPAAGGPVGWALALACAGTALPVMAGAAANVALVALLTEWIPEEIMGQVNAALMVPLTVSAAAGPLLAGFLGQVGGVRTAMFTSAVLGVLALPLLGGVLRSRTVKQ
jgi:MFS family permease